MNFAEFVAKYGIKHRLYFSPLPKPLGFNISTPSQFGAFKGPEFKIKTVKILRLPRKFKTRKLLHMEHILKFMWFCNRLENRDVIKGRSGLESFDTDFSTFK